MTLDEARAKADSLGIPKEDQTAAGLKAIGWDPGDPFAGHPLPTAVLTDAELKDELSLLVEDAKKQNVSAQVISAIVRFGGLLLA